MRNGSVGAAFDIDGPFVLVEAGDLGVGVEGARKRGSDGSGADWVDEPCEEGWDGDPSDSNR